MKAPAKHLFKNPWRRASAQRPGSRPLFWHRRLIGKPRPEEMHAAIAGEDHPDGQHAKAPLTQRAWVWIHATFPERQIYIRSDGRVQFFTFGASLQATLAGLGLIFLGWVAFATVNVVFKDRIIAAKDHRYRQMQEAYENRVADLQVSYEELNGALMSAQDRFKATADALQAKQNAIAGFLNRANQVQAAVSGGHGLAPLPSVVQNTASPSPPALALGAPATAEASGVSQLVVMPGPAQPQPRTARPVKSSLLGNGFKRIAALVQSVSGKIYPPAWREFSTLYDKHPTLRTLAEQTARIGQIGQTENLLMAQTQNALGHGVGALRNVMRRTGINPDSFAQRTRGEGMGGPEIPLDQVRIEGISDPEFTQAYLKAAAMLDELNTLSAALDRVPLTAPVSAASFDKSSSFGARVDPFTRRYAFHSGVDFAGPWGAVVRATAPGTVVFAGYRGGYGKMVEIDHGNGIRTRYGHLSVIGVRTGGQIGKGMGLGRVGSTGRSTGPHVHYEVWYDDVAKNPNNFIEAGRNVL
ncbi:MAG TPA: M23 family metallopeptidase [Rhizomicrobium sp.]|nr:M23 family metallopeptidase [Rhizomicrobium sp.]